MIGYMCRADFEYHLEYDPMGVRVYSTIEDVKRERGCTESCGIVEVDVLLNTIIEEGSSNHENF